MLLAIDIGNTNITVGGFRGGNLVATERAPTMPALSADELDVLLLVLLGHGGVPGETADGLVLASVVPALTSEVEALAARRGLELVIASAATVPIPIRVDRPADVGADRLVNAYAVGRLHGLPAVVADFGTASTFDAVGPDGAFLGGAIAPGLELGLDALATRTAKLPRVELRSPEVAIGRDTVGAIQAGAVLGHALLATAMLARMRQELAELAGVPLGAIRTVITGGLSAAPWATAIEGVDVVDPDLTLKGLALLHAETAARRPLATGRR